MTLRISKSTATRVTLASLLLSLGHFASATVVFDNYRGQANLTAGAISPNYNNNQGDNSLTNLITFAGGGAPNIASSGSLDNMDWGGEKLELCNKQKAPNTSCDNQIMGRVAYALVQFPTAGVYTFKASHDDDLQVEFSTSFSAASAANYRNFDYNVPVGTLIGFTNENAFPAIPGNFVAAQNNSCYAMRVYWNNRGNINFLHMKWVKPDGTDEIIPSTYLLDPSDPASYANCAGGVTDFGVSKTGPAQFSPGGTLTYTITVWNYGPSLANSVPVSDLLPDKATYTSLPTCTPSGSAQCGTVSGNSTSVLMTTGTLPVNNTAGNPNTAPTQGSYLTYTFTIKADPSSLSLRNTASIATNDPNPDNNTSTVVSQSTGKVNVIKTGPAASVTVGQPFDYHFTVNNGLGVAVANAQVAEQLPGNIQAQSASGATCTPMPSAPGALLSCRLTSSIAAGGSGTFTLTAVATGIGVVTNYASTDPSGGTNSGTPGPKCDTSKYSCTSAKTEVIAPPVTVAKSFTPDTISAGGSSLLNITVSNTHGSSVPLTGLSLTDTLPANVTTTGAMVGNTCGGNLTSPGNTQLVLDSGTLDANTTCQLQWMVTSPTAGNWTNIIAPNSVGSAEGATNPAPAQATLVVNTPAALSTSKALSMVNGQPYQGQKLRNYDVLVYAITVTNSGGSAASTTIKETVPNGAEYKVGSNEGWDTSPGCFKEASTCIQRVDVTAYPDPGSSVTKYFTMTITPPVLTPTLVNTVQTSVGDCKDCTLSSPGVYADMFSTPAKSQEVKVGDNVKVVTTCSNKGPDYGVNATCTITGAPAGSVISCVPDKPVAQFQVGDFITCTTTFTATQAGPVMITTTARSETRDPVPRNNATFSPVTVIDVTPIADAKAVPMDARWMLALITLAIAAAAGLRMGQRRP